MDSPLCRSRRQRLLPYHHLLLWNLAISLAIPLIGFAFSRRGITASDFLREGCIAFCYTQSISTLFYALMPILMPRLGRWNSTFKWPALIVFKASMAVTGTLIAGVLLSVLKINPWEAYWPFFENAVQISLAVTLVFGSGATAYHVLHYRLEDARLALRTREMEHERALKLATQARLASLESRVHPHFLFNALNSITSLIREDPEHAERLLVRMSALLRFSLDAGQAGLVTLAQEMKIVEDYLAIERARYGGRLEYRIGIDPGLAEVELPPLAVQTLVENSVKFAVGPQRRGALIEIRAEQREQQCRITVEDDGPGFRNSELPAGHGLDNLQARLQSHFGDAAQLTIARDGGRTCVSILLPTRVLVAP